MAGKSAIRIALDRRKLILRLRRVLPSTTQGINRAVADVLKLARKTGCCAAKAEDLEIALREALANAVIHGNQQDPKKKVLLRGYCDPEHGMLIAIRDEGAGFDPAAVPDPRGAERLHLTHGRGIFLMHELMDHVEHRKGGREVVLIKRAVPKAAAAGIAGRNKSAGR